VSYNDIQTFITWLHKKTTETFRLPTESEWEYAARAGTHTVYSWGDTIGTTNANCGGCGSIYDANQTAPVGSFAANAFGLYDMHGNVWEWVEDIYNSDYNSTPTDGSDQLSGSSDRVLRGGSWNYLPFYLRSANRFRGPATYRGDSVGFRLVQD
jgi:formylglycine-generating enzyme required for sulfatase activity